MWWQQKHHPVGMLILSRLGWLGGMGKMNGATHRTIVYK